MRTDGLQEYLLKDPTILNNNDRITKMRKAIQAVSIAARSVFQQLVHRSMPFFPPHSFFCGRVRPIQNLWLLSMSSSWDRKLPLPTLTNPWLSKLFRYHSKNEFLSLLLHDETVMTNFTHQLPSGQSVRTISNNIVREMVSGISVNIVKPLLVSEVRRIVPTAVGLPLEFSLLTAAVAGASVRGGQKLQIFDCDCLSNNFTI